MSTRAVRIAVGTTNPAKLAAVERATIELFDQTLVVPVPVELDIPAQPWGDGETARGAMARAQAALTAIDATYGAGIESGLVDGPGGRIYVISWAAVVDRSGSSGFGGSERFALPLELADELGRGAELGPLLDSHFGQRGLSRREGAVGLLSDGRRDRAGILSLAVLHAFLALLEPWRHTALE